MLVCTQLSACHPGFASVVVALGVAILMLWLGRCAHYEILPLYEKPKTPC